MLSYINKLMPVMISLLDTLVRIQEVKTRRIELEVEIEYLTIVSNEILTQIRTIVGTRTEERRKILDAFLEAFNQYVDKYEADMIIRIGQFILALVDKPIITEEEVTALASNLLNSRNSINNNGNYNDETIYI